MKVAFRDRYTVWAFEKVAATSVAFADDAPAFGYARLQHSRL